MNKHVRRFSSLLVLLLPLMIALAPTAVLGEEERAEKVAYVVQSGNIYKSLSPDSDILMIAPRHSHYKILETSPEWLRVQTSRGPGWIRTINCRIDEKSNISLKEAGNTRFILFFSAILIALIVGVAIFLTSRKDDEEEFDSDFL
ncbi:hypothetical protein [Chitinivibrio alkaliphilus]|uniref:SH3b domain-containing protein n=1 Tax=Chitinivibrio alkaliphilus ACht1 TaxID=1313304 RepID=U7D847_9BACT|nr:hypothetical protein [Chitinivibrio alkaliphilus]ERP31257.1 hypothetical protein CALK_1875 [Chitinivibrio alkaliphilus ACht1]